MGRGEEKEEKVEDVEREGAGGGDDARLLSSLTSQRTSHFKYLT